MTLAHIPEASLGSHTAILGMTGSGKTSTAKLAVEQVVKAGGRVCVLDPIKSDWWGMVLAADGKKPGIPFTILGGPKGHMPLPVKSGKAIAEVVASGALPLSILDMADFGPGQQNHFFEAFAEILFKRITGVVHLVMEEAHTFAPKNLTLKEEPMSLFWAKKLASGSRTKGLRVIVCTQRTQSLHNDLLSSCETVIAHRMTFPADQKTITDWIKARTGSNRRPSNETEPQRLASRSQQYLGIRLRDLGAGRHHCVADIRHELRLLERTAAP